MAEKQTSHPRNGRPKPAELGRLAAAMLAELTGRRPESVLGLRKEGDCWKVTVEVLELQRVPSSTDLLGSYVVTLGEDGELLGYERTRRYARGAAGEDRQ